MDRVEETLRRRTFGEKMRRLEEACDGERCVLVRRDNVKWATHFPGLAFYADFEEERYALLVPRMDLPAVREWPVPEELEVLEREEARDLPPARVSDSRRAPEYVPCYRLRVSDDVRNVKLSKTKGEVEVIRGLVEVTEGILRSLIPEEGRAESEVAAELAARARELGVSPSFDPIVGYDEGSGVPHHRPQPDRREWKHTMLVDFGLRYVYCTDVTRTVCAEEGNAVPVLETVCEALESALGELRAGVDPKEVEERVREEMEGEFQDFSFPHSLGHHVGVTVHEGRLRGELPEGAVITVEPGLYSERFGVRVEEMVVVRGNGCEVLTNLPREWIV